MRLKLISCEVMYREMCAALARSPNQIDVQFLPKGLHDRGPVVMLTDIQAMVDSVDPRKYDAIVMGYGLCGNGLAGLQARTIPLVVPRAHDCITLFLGDKDRYMRYFNSHPGVYFKTTGWIERGAASDHQTQLALARHGQGLTHEQLVAKYGEENAEYLEQELNRYKQQYRQFTFIEMGVEPDNRFELCTSEEAAMRGWRFEKLRGDMSLIQDLLDGNWDELRYVTVQPGWRLVARYDDGVIGTERVNTERTGAEDD